MKIYISHSGNYDYESELYNPIKSSEIFKEHDIFLPHEPDNREVKARDIIQSYELMVCEVSYPSTGQGIEIGLAVAASVPVVCFYKRDTKPSSSLRFYSEQTVEYTDAEDFLAKLAQAIQAKS